MTGLDTAECLSSDIAIISERVVSASKISSTSLLSLVVLTHYLSNSAATMMHLFIFY